MNRKKEFLAKLADLMEEYKASFRYTNADNGISINIDCVSLHDLGPEVLHPTFLNDGDEAYALVRTAASKE